MSHLPLNQLSDDELMFQQEIEKFAASAIAPKVMHMDESETLDKELLKQLFEMV